MEASPVSEASSSPTSATPLISLQPARLEFRDVRVGVEQSTELQVTNNLASELELGIRAGNSERYSVSPAKIILRGGETGRVNVKLKLVRSPPPRRSGGGKTAAAGDDAAIGYRDHFYVKSIYFDQRFASVFFLASQSSTVSGELATQKTTRSPLPFADYRPPRHAPSSSTTPRDKRAVSFVGTPAMSQRQDEVETEADVEEAREMTLAKLDTSTPISTPPTVSTATFEAEEEERQESRTGDIYDAFETAAHVGGDAVDVADGDFEDEDIDYEQSADDDDTVIADETDAVISSLQRQLGEIDEELVRAATTSGGRAVVADTPGSRSAAVLSRAMESSTEELVAARRANEALRSRLNEAEAELETMHAFQASLESATPGAQELVQAAVLRMGAVANERSKQAAEHLESKDLELRREQDKLKELLSMSQELKGALVLAEESLRRSESRCAEAIESRSALRLDLSKKETEINTLAKQLERERRKQRATAPDNDASRETVQQLSQENAMLREDDAELRSRLDMSRKEMEIFQSSLEQTRAELSMKRIQESERSKEHENEIAALKREHEARESDLRLQVAELKATIETLNSTLPSDKENFDEPIAELRRGIANEFRLAKEEISDSIKHVFVAGTSENSTRDLVQHQTAQIADLQLQLAQAKSELRLVETSATENEDAALLNGGTSTSSATLTRMRTKIGQLAAAEESARVALEKAESRAFTAEQKVDDAERRIQFLQSELQDSSEKLRSIEMRHDQKSDKLSMRAGSASTLEKTSRKILDEIAQESEMEMSALREELQKERESHICTKVSAEAEERRLQMHVEDLEHRLRHHANDGIIHKQRLLQTIRTLSSRSDLHKEAAKSASEISRLTRSEAKLQSDVAFLKNRVATLSNHLNQARNGVLKQLERNRKNYAEVETNTVDPIDASTAGPAPEAGDARRSLAAVLAHSSDADVGLTYASTTSSIGGGGSTSTNTRVENMQRELITRENQLSQTRANLEIAKIDAERLRMKTAELSKAVSDARDAVCERDRQLYDCREKTRQLTNDVAARHRSETAALSTRMAVAERREHEAVAAKEEAERRMKNTKLENEKLLSSIASLRAVHERELAERKDNIRLTEEENAKSTREIEQLSSLVEEKTVQIQVLTDTLEALQTSSKSEIEQGIVTMSAQLAALKAQEQCTERRARDAMSSAESSRRLLEMSQGDLKECKEVLMSRDAQIAEYRVTVDATDQEAQSMRLELRAYEERISSNARELDDLEENVRKKDVELEGVRRALAAQRQRHFEQLTAERATTSEQNRAETNLSGLHALPEAASSSSLASSTSVNVTLEQMISKLTSELAEQRKDVMWDKTEKEASRNIIDFLCSQLLDVDRRLNRALVEGRQSSSRCVSAEARSRQLETELDIELSSGIEMRYRVDMAENLRDRQRTIILEHTDAHLAQQGRRVAVLSSALEKANKALMALESKCTADERQHAVTVGTLESTAHALRMAQAEHVEMRAEIMALTEELDSFRGQAVDAALNDFYTTYVEGTLSDEKTKSGRFTMLTKQILAMKYNEQMLQSSLSSSKTRLSGCQQKLVRVSEELRALNRRNELLTSGKEPNNSAPVATAPADVSNTATETADNVARQLSLSSQENQALQQSCWNLRQRVAELELELDGVRSHAKALDESAKLTQSQHKASMQSLHEQLSSEFATRLQHAHDDIADASKRFADNIAKLKSEHESAIHLLQEEHSAKLSKLEAQHEAHTGRLHQIHQENVERTEHEMVPREHMTKEQKTSKYLRGQLEAYIAENDKLAGELHEIASRARTLEQDLERKDILITELGKDLSKVGGGERRGSKLSDSSSREGFISTLAKQHISAKLHEADLVRKVRVAARTEIELRELIRRRDERIDELKSQVADGSNAETHVKTSALPEERGEDEASSSIEPHAAGLRSKLAVCEAELDTVKHELAMTLARETTSADASREDYKLLYQQFENLTSRADLVRKQLKDLQTEASFAVGLIVGAVAKTHKSYNHTQTQESLSLKGAVQLVLARMADYESRIKALKSELASASSNTSVSAKSKERGTKSAGTDAATLEPMKVSAADVDLDGSQKRLIASLQNRVAQLGRERINLLQDKDKLSERLRGIRLSLGHGSKYPRRTRSTDVDATPMVNGAVQTDECETAGATQEYAEAWKTRCRMLEEEIESLREFTAMRDREMQQHVQDASDAYLSQLQTEDILSEAFDAARSQDVTPPGEVMANSHASSSQLLDSRRHEVAFMLKEKEMHAMRARRDSESELEKLRGDIVELKAAVLYERSSSARTREELSSALERLQRCTTEEESMRHRIKQSSEQCERLRNAHDELAKVNSSLKLEYRNALNKLELAEFSISTEPSSQENVTMLVEQKLLALEKSVALFQRSSSAALENLSRRADSVERLSSDGTRQSFEAVVEIEELARGTEAQTTWLTDLVRGAEDAKWAYSSRSSKLLQQAEQASFEIEEERSARAAIQTKADALERKVEHLESTASRPGKLAKLSRRVSDLQTKLTRSSEETASLKADRDDLRGKLHDAEKISSALTSSLQETQAELTRIIQGSRRSASSSQPSSRSKSVAKISRPKHLVSLHQATSSLRKKKLLQASTAARAARIDLSSEIESVEAILTYERERLRETEEDLEAAVNSQAALRDRNKNLNTQMRVVRERNQQLLEQVKKLQESTEDSQTMISNITNVVPNELQQQKSALASLRRQLVTAQNELSRRERSFKESEEQKEELTTQVKDLQRRLRQALTTMTKRDGQLCVDSKIDEAEEMKQRVVDADDKITALQTRVRDLSANLKRKDTLNGELREQNRRLAADLDATKVTIEVEASKTSSSARRLRSDIAKKDAMIKEFQRKMTDISASTAMATSEAAAASRREVQAWRVAGADAAVMRHCAAVMLGSLQEAALLCLRLTGGMRRLAYVCCVHVLRQEQQQQRQQQRDNADATTSDSSSARMLQLPTDDQSIASIAEMVGLQRSEVTDLLSVGQSVSRVAAVARRGIEFDKDTKLIEEDLVRKLCSELEAGLGKASVSDAALSASSTATPAAIVAAKGALVFDEEPLHKLLELLEQVAMKAEAAAAEARGAVKINE